MANRVHTAEVTEGIVLSSRTTMQLKVSFSFNHLLVAADAARNASRIEEANRSGASGDLLSEMMRCVPVSVVMAGAALEASANELIHNILDGSAGLKISPTRAKLLKGLENERFGNAIGKYEKLALLLDKEPNTGTESWRNARLLVEFRNQFMHFKPVVYVDGVDDERKFVKQLTENVPLSSVYRSQKVQFPYSFLSYGCAKWAVESALKLSADICGLLGVQDKFTLPGLDFNLP